MKQNRLTLMSSAFFLSIALQAQEPATESKMWTLKDCIEYAIANNIQLQQSRISQEESEVNLKSAKAALFPTLSFSTNQNVTNRPKSESFTNIVDDGAGSMTATASDSKTSYNGSYGLNASWTVWNGGIRQKNIKLQKLNRDVAGLAVTESENSLQESITQLYVQILYTTESIEVNKEALQLSEIQRDRAKEMLAVGSISKSDVAQLEAQVAEDNYQLINAQATLQNYKLQLKQLLELDGIQEMQLATPILADEEALQELPSQLSVYEAALASRPEIQSGKLNVESADLNVRIAKSGYMPTLSLNAGIGSNNSSGTGRSFSDQLKNNWSNSVGLTLSVPIFDNRQNKSAVERAKLQRESSQLDLLNEQKNLFSTIESLWLNARTAQERLKAAMASVESSQASYDLVSEQFRLGLRNTIQLLTEKNNLLSAEQNRLESKYTAILNAQLLNFYQGGEINI